MLIKILPNIIAMVLSSIAAIMLLAASTKIGGFVKRVFDLLIGGILLSVSIHAGFEVVAALGILTEDQLMPIMGILLSGGSMFFIAAAILAAKKFK